MSKVWREEQNATTKGLPEAFEAQVVSAVHCESLIPGVVTGASAGTKAKLGTEGQPHYKKFGAERATGVLTPIGVTAEAMPRAMTAAPKVCGHGVQGDPATGVVALPRETSARKAIGQGAISNQPERCCACDRPAERTCQCGAAICAIHLYDCAGEWDANGMCGACVDEQGDYDRI